MQLTKTINLAPYTFADDVAKHFAGEDANNDKKKKPELTRAEHRRGILEKGADIALEFLNAIA